MATRADSIIRRYLKSIGNIYMAVESRELKVKDWREVLPRGGTRERRISARAPNGTGKAVLRSLAPSG